MAIIPRIKVEAPDHERASLAIATSTAIEKGDLISWESNAAVLVDNVGEDATFAGYAITQHNTAFVEPDRLVVGKVGIVELDSTSATYTFGQDVMYTSENAVVDSTNGATAMCWANEYKTTATRLECYINAPLLLKLWITTPL